GVTAEHPAGKLTAVAQDHRDLLGTIDDVVVGDDDAVGADDESRAGPLLCKTAPWRSWREAGPTERTALSEPLGQPIPGVRRLRDRRHLDVHDRRLDLGNESRE